MDKEDAIIALRVEQNNYDPECAHANADSILCEFLTSLGYSDIVEEFEAIHKWYA